MRAGGDRWQIRAVPDAPPSISIERPTSNLSLTPRAVVPLRVTARTTWRCDGSRWRSRVPTGPINRRAK